MLDEQLGKNIEKNVGLSLEEIRAIGPLGLLRYLQEKTGKIVKVIVIQDFDLITRVEINKEIDRILGIL